MKTKQDNTTQNKKRHLKVLYKNTYDMDFTFSKRALIAPGESPSSLPSDGTMAVSQTCPIKSTNKREKR